jgi:hypothetical protein
MEPTHLGHNVSRRYFTSYLGFSFNASYLSFSFFACGVEQANGELRRGESVPKPISKERKHHRAYRPQRGRELDPPVPPKLLV